MIIKCNSDLILRSISTKDTESVLRWRNSESVRKYFNHQEEITKAEHEKWLETKVSTGQVYQFIVHDRVLGQDLGSVYLKDIDRKKKTAEYGIFLGEKEAFGRGIGTIVCKAIIGFAFKELHLQSLYLQVHSVNLRAIRCYEKAGFVQKALLKDKVYVNGEYRDLVIMDIVNEGEV